MENTNNARVAILRTTLKQAIGMYLQNEKNPRRKVSEIDNRGSTFYLVLYWAQALATQDNDLALKERFTKVARDLADKETAITEELLGAQGAPVEIGGYYHPDDELAEKAMRPSATLNAIIDAL